MSSKDSSAVVCSRCSYSPAMVMPSMRRVGEATTDPGAINAPMSQKRDMGQAQGGLWGTRQNGALLFVATGKRRRGILARGQGALRPLKPKEGLNGAPTGRAKFVYLWFVAPDSTSARKDRVSGTPVSALSGIGVASSATPLGPAAARCAFAEGFFTGLKITPTRMDRVSGTPIALCFHRASLARGGWLVGVDSIFLILCAMKLRVGWGTRRVAKKKTCHH